MIVTGNMNTIRQTSGKVVTGACEMPEVNESGNYQWTSVNEKVDNNKKYKIN